MIVSSDRDAVDLVLGYCELQLSLVECFLAFFRPKDREYFHDVERIGTLQLGTQTWRYTRHGAGVMFESPDAVVDAHKGLAAWPRGVDAWRLLQYLESRGITEFSFDGEHTVIDYEEAGLERILRKMVQHGILQEVPLTPRRGLFVPLRSADG
jgi:hypothetical protein